MFVNPVNIAHSRFRGLNNSKNPSVKSFSGTPFHAAHSAQTPSDTPRFQESITRSIKIHPISTDITLKGRINDKGLNVKMSFGPSLFGRNEYYRGTLGDKGVDVQFKNNNFRGKVGEKDININFSNKLNSKFSVSGNIGEKQISIQNGSSVLEAKGEHDVLTLLAALSGHRFGLQDEKFDALYPSIQRTEDYFSSGFYAYNAAAGHKIL